MSVEKEIRFYFLNSSHLFTKEYMYIHDLILLHTSTGIGISFRVLVDFMKCLSIYCPRNEITVGQFVKVIF